MLNKRIVLYIGGFELPDKNAAAQRVIANGKLMRDLGYTVVFDGLTKDIYSITSLATPRIYFGFETYARLYPAGFKQWVYHTVQYKRYKDLIDKYKNVYAIIAYNLPSGCLYRLYLYCRKMGIKLIADCTEWYAIPKGGLSIYKLVKRLDIFLRMRVITPRLDAIISISSFLNNYYLKKGSNSIQIPPLVDLRDPKWMAKKICSNEIVHILYAGSPFSISNKYNVKDRIDWIIAALAQLKMEGNRFVFHVIGVTKDDLLNFFPQLQCDISNLGNSIVFYGKISHYETIELLRSSDYAIFLRDRNRVTLAGFPTKFVEAISSGIPVLTNKSSNLTDYLIEGENGLWINVTNKDTIKQSLKNAILMDRSKIDDMKKICAMSELFDYRRYIDEFAKILG